MLLLHTFKQVFHTITNNWFCKFIIVSSYFGNFVELSCNATLKIMSYTRHEVALFGGGQMSCETNHDAVIKWKHFQRYWPCMREIVRPPVEFPEASDPEHVFFDLCLNKRLSKHSDLRRHHGHYVVTVITLITLHIIQNSYIHSKPCQGGSYLGCNK